MKRPTAKVQMDDFDRGFNKGTLDGKEHGPVCPIEYLTGYLTGIKL
jgi:hypothetical protein